MGVHPDCAIPVGISAIAANAATTFIIACFCLLVATILTFALKIIIVHDVGSCAYTLTHRVKSSLRPRLIHASQRRGTGPSARRRYSIRYFPNSHPLALRCGHELAMAKLRALL